MLFHAIIFAFSINSLMLAHADLTDCPLDGTLQVEGRDVADELKRLEKDTQFLENECARKPCNGRHYNRILDNVRDKLEESSLRPIEDIVEALAKNQPKKAERLCVKLSAKLGHKLSFFERRDLVKPDEPLEKALTLVGFFESEANRMMDRYGVAFDQLNETIAYNSVSHAISEEEIKTSKALIELGKIAQFNKDVNVLLGQEQKAGLEQVKSAYATHIGSTKPLMDVVHSEALKQVISLEHCDLCEFSQKLALVGADEIKEHLYDEALAELKQIDNEFGQLLEKDIVVPLKNGQVDEAYDSAKKIASAMNKRNPIKELKKLYAERNIHQSHFMKLIEEVPMRSYFYYLLAGMYIQQDELRKAEKILNDLKEDRIDYTGVPVDKLLRMQGKVAFLSAIKFIQ